jgi:hypothetical protein
MSIFSDQRVVNIEMVVIVKDVENKEKGVKSERI